VDGALVKDGETLCRACGLCCDGSLFSRVPLRPDEPTPPLVSLNTTPYGARYVTQRCTALSEQGCGCYQARPRACRGFECLVLTALNADEVSLADALALVTRVRAQVGAERDASLRFHFGRR
jgi:uncharacterized protein